MGRDLVQENGKFAVRETISDEEIVTPWFDTKEELATHLVEKGDSWGSKARDFANAMDFIRIGHVPSMMFGPAGLQNNYECAFPEKDQSK